jgi:hypothetical protein
MPGSRRRSTGSGQAPARAQAPAVTDTTILLPQEIDSVRSGQTRRGRLEAGDWTMGDGTYADIWYLRGQAGQRVTITLRSRDFDAYLQLLDAAGTRIADDDDSGGGQGAARIAFTLRSSERYQIVVNSFGDEPQNGVYTIEVR